MKTLNVTVSDEVAEALRVEAERAGESTEQLIGRLIDVDLRRRGGSVYSPPSTRDWQRQKQATSWRSTRTTLPLW